MKHHHDHNNNGDYTPLDTSLQPSDLSQYYGDQNANSILCIAPAEGNVPIEVISNEAAAFPYHFPDGNNTFITSRPVKLTLKKYFNSRLFSSDARFASDSQYIFFAQYTAELQQIFSSISIAMRKRGNSFNITAPTLLNSEKMKTMLKKDECYRFLQGIRGSPPYWERTTRDLFAMLKQLGMPTFFVSFSAADRRWPEIIEAICKQQGRDVPEDLNWTEYYNIINSNIVTATRMWDKRLHDFITHIVKGPLQPLGKVMDIFGRIEFQARGWPHYHGLLWIADAPVYGKSPEAAVTAFIDKFTTSQLPDPKSNLFDIVSSVQCHSKRHTNTCKKGGKKCRFNFPRPASERTFIASPVESNDNESESSDFKHMSTKIAKDILKKFWKALTDDSFDDVCTGDVLQRAGISQHDLEKALNVLSQRPTIMYKRQPQDCWVNVYNPILLAAWDGNMDIQFVLDPYCCIMYIMSYITKAEKELGNMIKAAQIEARKDNLDGVQELRKLGQIYLTHREISVMEAVYRVCGLKLKHCSKEVVWIPTDPDSTRITLPLHIIKSNVAQGNDNVWMTSIMDRFLARPMTAEFNDMCAAKFASAYRVVSASSTSQDNSSDDENNVQSKISKKISLLKNMGTIVKRCNEAVIRYPNFSKIKNPEKCVSNSLRLFLPHRKKNFLPPEYATYEQYYETGNINLNSGQYLVKAIVQRNMSQFQKFNDEIDEAWALVKELPPLEDGWASVAPNSEQQRIDDINEQEIVSNADPISAEDIPEMYAHKSEETKFTDGKPIRAEPDPKAITDEIILEMNRSLNTEQMQLFNHIKKWCLSKLRNECPEPFDIFLTGGAGSGKSRVIKSVYHMANKLFLPTRETAHDKSVLKVAYTGQAAINIGGQTIHSAFNLKRNMNKSYKPLPENELTTLRSKLENVKLLIIDEISMVNKTILSYISGRLNQIMSLKSGWKPFGGISVLGVGDFYQIPPVFGSTLLNIDDGALPADLWTLFKIHKLKKIMRQKDDIAFAEALNAIRTRLKREKLNPEHENLFKSRLVSGNDYPQDIIHIFATNKKVNAHNKRKLQELKSVISTLTAVDIIHSGGKTYKSRKPENALDASLPATVDVAVGARIMLCVNIDTEDGLVNGAFGTIVDIHEGSKRYGLPDRINVSFDDQKVGIAYRKKNESNGSHNYVSFRPCSVKAPYKTTYVTRTQYPFRLAWACTIHKTQGLTFKQAAVSMKGIFKAGMAYVALSRVTCLSGLYLLDYDPNLIYASPEVAKALLQMELLDLQEPFSKEDMHKDSISVIHHNVQSLRKHFVDVKKMIQTDSPAVFCCTETWLRNTDKHTGYDHPGYKFECINSIQERGAGVAVYIKNTVNYKVIHSKATEHYEILCIFLIESKILIATVYRHCKSPVSCIQHLPQNLLELCEKFHSTSSPKVLVTGDFNDSTTFITDTFSSYGFQQIIKGPTTISGSSLDKIFVHKIPFSMCGILCSYFSLHLPIFISIQMISSLPINHVTSVGNSSTSSEVKFHQTTSTTTSNASTQSFNSIKSLTPTKITKEPKKCKKRKKNFKKINVSLTSSFPVKNTPTSKNSCNTTNILPNNTPRGFESDGSTPSFPLPTNISLEPLKFTGLARVVDMWTGNENTIHLIQWLKAIGFSVISDLDNHQYGASCGYIAAHTAWLFHTANDWQSVHVPTNVERNVYSIYNSILDIESNEPGFLTDMQILKIVHHLSGSDSTTAANLNWFDSPVPINYFIVGIREFLLRKRRITEKDKELRIVIVNTTPVRPNNTQDITGDHWITIAYKFCSR